jgi:hypothetical protein
LTNTIVWGSCASGLGGEAYVGTGASVTFVCCDVNSPGIAGPGTVTWGTGNIFTDPLFCDPVSCTNTPTTAGCYMLQECSPCVNAPGCGQIGAHGIGCPCGGGPSPAVETSWGGIKALFRE